MSELESALRHCLRTVSGAAEEHSPHDILACRIFVEARILGITKVTTKQPDASAKPAPMSGKTDRLLCGGVCLMIVVELSWIRTLTWGMRWTGGVKGVWEGAETPIDANEVRYHAAPQPHAWPAPC